MVRVTNSFSIFTNTKICGIDECCLFELDREC